MVTLRSTHTKVRRELVKQIKTGKDLKLETATINDRTKLRDVVSKKMTWDEYNEQILFQLFSNNDFRDDYRSAMLYRNSSGWTKDINLYPSYYDTGALRREVEKMETMIDQCLHVLESVLNQLKVIPESQPQLPS